MVAAFYFYTIVSSNEGGQENGETLEMDGKQLKKTEKPCKSKPIWKRRNLASSPATNPRIFLDLLVKGEKHVITRRSTYQKIY